MKELNALQELDFNITLKGKAESKLKILYQLKGKPFIKNRVKNLLLELIKENKSLIEANKHLLENKQEVKA